MGGATAVNEEFGTRKEEVVSYGSEPTETRREKEKEKEIGKEISEKGERRRRGASVSERRRRMIEEEEEEIEERLRRMEMGSNRGGGRDNRGIEETIEDKMRRMETGSTGGASRRSRRERTSERESGSVRYSSRIRSEVTENPTIFGGRSRIKVLDEDPEMMERDIGIPKRVPITHQPAPEIPVTEEHKLDHNRALAEEKPKSIYSSVRGGSERGYKEGIRGEGTREHGNPYTYKEHRNYSPNPSRRGESRRDRRRWAGFGEREIDPRSSWEKSVSDTSIDTWER